LLIYTYFLWMYACIDVHNSNMYMCMYVLENSNMYMCMYVCLYAYVQVCIHTYIHIQIYVYVCWLYMCIYMYSYIRILCIYVTNMHMFICMYMNIYLSKTFQWIFSWNDCWFSIDDHLFKFTQFNQRFLIRRSLQRFYFLPTCNVFPKPVL